MSKDARARHPGVLAPTTRPLFRGCPAARMQRGALGVPGRRHHRRGRLRTNGRRHSASPLPRLRGEARDMQRAVQRHLSTVSKTALHSPSGNLSAAPAHLPGSSHHLTLSGPIRAAKLGGAFIGDPDACSSAALATITARLAPLSHIVQMTDTDTIDNVAQLQTNLIRLNASLRYSTTGRSRCPDRPLLRRDRRRRLIHHPPL